MPLYSYHAKSVPAMLRDMADRMEAAEEAGEQSIPEVAVVVHGSLGEIFYVEAAGQAGSIEALGVLRLGDQILTDAIRGIG